MGKWTYDRLTDILSVSLHISFVCKVPEKEASPLTGVVICVGKKLSKMQSELNAIAASLGADFRYSAHPYWLQRPHFLV